jgi:hypothetical protein
LLLLLRTKVQKHKSLALETQILALLSLNSTHKLPGWPKDFITFLSPFVFRIGDPISSTPILFLPENSL